MQGVKFSLFILIYIRDLPEINKIDLNISLQLGMKSSYIVVHAYSRALISTKLKSHMDTKLHRHMDKRYGCGPKGIN